MSDLNVDDLLSMDDAVARIDAEEVLVELDTIELERCMGYVLAEDVLSDRAYPPVDKSLVDGFAVRRADLATVPALLTIVGTTAPGEAVLPIDAGEAVHVMTGAAIPPGADAVVPVEFAQRQDDRVRIERAPDGPNLARRGSECEAGRIVLRAGTRLGPGAIGVLAQVGFADVRCALKPVVAILVTGDELVDIDTPARPWQTRDVNTHLVTSLLNRLDYEVAYERTAPDHPKRIRDQINLLKDEFDVLIVTGGMSMGEHDHVPRVLKELGFQSRVSKLRMKPGKPFVFAARRRGDQPQFAFGLPGNPVSAFCCTLLLVSRLLDRIEGATPRVSPVECVLAESVPANGPREFYQPALREGYKVRPLAWRGSADVFTLAQADVLLIRPENDGPREAGAVVRCIEMPA